MRSTQTRTGQSRRWRWHRKCFTGRAIPSRQTVATFPTKGGTCLLMDMDKLAKMGSANLNVEGLFMFCCFKKRTKLNTTNNMQNYNIIAIILNLNRFTQNTQTKHKLHKITNAWYRTEIKLFVKYLITYNQIHTFN